MSEAKLEATALLAPFDELPKEDRKCIRQILVRRRTFGSKLIPVSGDSIEEFAYQKRLPSIRPLPPISFRLQAPFANIDQVMAHGAH
jgi:hypothetical protein